MSSFLESLEQMISDNLLRSVSSQTNTSKEVVTSSLGMAIPVILKVFQGADQFDFADLGNNLARCGKLAMSEDTKGQNQPDSTSSDIAAMSRASLTLLFGSNEQDFYKLISSQNAIDLPTSKFICQTAMNLTSIFLGRKMISQGVNISGMIKWIQENDHEIMQVLPTSADKLIEKAISGKSQIVQPILKPIPFKKILFSSSIALILLISLWLGARSCHNHYKSSATVNDIEAPIAMESESPSSNNPTITSQDSMIDPDSGKEGMLDEHGNWIPSKTEETFIKLANGKEIKSYKNFFEDKLCHFIKDPTAIAGKDIWFEMEDVQFASGKYSLTQQADHQLQNLLEILKAYPELVIKIGAYTDASGDEKSNEEISKKRAQSVHKFLIANGASPKSFDAVPFEGYGSKHPRSDNDYPLGRAKNRRIAISVRSK